MLVRRMARILIAGCGYVGSVLGERLVAVGHEVWGLRRQAVALPDGVQLLRADLARIDSLRVVPSDVDFVVYAAGPKSGDERDYRDAYIDGPGNLLRALSELGERPRRIFFVSSTSVYGQSRGEWVDEESPTDPRRFAGEILLTAERLIAAGDVPATMLRLAGIYGPGRARLVERVRSGEAAIDPTGPRYTNRIHRDDAAGALAHLIALPKPERCYLGVDAEPADEADVLRWLAAELGVPPPRGRGEAENPPVRRSGSKRCRSDRLRSSGYELRYPTFREGYRELL